MRTFLTFIAFTHSFCDAEAMTFFTTKTILTAVMGACLTLSGNAIAAQASKPAAADKENRNGCDYRADRSGNFRRKSQRLSLGEHKHEGLSQGWAVLWGYQEGQVHDGSRRAEGRLSRG
jgi:hypothetical protein